MTLLEIEEYLRSSNSQLIRSSVSKPWKNQKIVPGKVKGIWYDTILADPKTFNQLIAERDGSSAAILDNVLDCLVDYDMENKFVSAINSGYRLIDTSAAYRNEKSIGKAVKRSGVPREQISLIQYQL